MPRSVSGNYTLPLPPVVANTVIQAAWANTTDDDIAQAITDSLDRYGRGGMVAPLRFVDGTETVPAIAFSAETGTGLWRDGTGVLAFSVLGAKVGQWSAAGLLAADITTLNLTATNVLTSVVDADDIIVSGTAHVSGSVLFDSSLEVVGDSYLHGRLGIGLAPTTIKLHVSDGIAGVARLNSTAGSGTYLGIASSTSLVARFGVGSAVVTGAANTDVGIRAENSGNIMFSASGAGTEHMRLDTSGNLGIGVVPSGTYKLQLTTTATNIARFDSTNASGGFINISLSNVSRARIGSGPTVIVGGGLNDLALRSDSGNILFSANGSTEMMRLDASGNLGIGATPTNRLHVAAVDDARVMADGTGSGTGSGGTFLWARTGVGCGALGVRANRFGDSSSATYFQANSGLTIATGGGSGTGAMEINTSQQVGIGGTPTVKLEVFDTSPTVKLTASSAASPAVVQFNGAATVRAYLASIGAASAIITGSSVGDFGIRTVAGRILFSTDNGVTGNVEVHTNGNLGVGTITGAITPAVRVHAVAPAAGARFRVQSSDASGAVADFLADGAVQGQIGTNTGHPFVISANSTVRIGVPAVTSAPVYVMQNALPYNIGLDPGGNSAQIPIGGIIAGDGAGAAIAATVALGTVTLTGANTITLTGFTGTIVLSSGTYRMVSRVSANFALWVRTA